MVYNLYSIASPDLFEKFCWELLTKIHPTFQAIAAPDGGLDGIIPEERVGFQFYYPIKGAKKTKIVADVKKIHKYWRDSIDELIWMTPFELTMKNRLWAEETAYELKYDLSMKYWGPGRISESLVLYGELIDKYRIEEQFPHVSKHGNVINQQADTIINAKNPKITIQKHGTTKIYVQPPSDALTDFQCRYIADEIKRIAFDKGLTKEQQKAFYKSEFGKMKRVFQVSNWRFVPQERFPDINEYLRKLRGVAWNAQTTIQTRMGLLKTIYAKGSTFNLDHAAFVKYIENNFGYKLHSMSEYQLREVIAWLKSQSQ